MDNDLIEPVVIKHLLHKDYRNYGTKFYPFLKPDYFSSEAPKEIFKLVQKYYTTYSDLPSYNDLYLLADKAPEEVKTKITSLLDDIQKTQTITPELLEDKTKEFVKERDLYISMVSAVDILSNGNEQEKLTAPTILQESLGINFNENIGLNYTTSAQDRIERYQKVNENGFKTGIKTLDDLTEGGFQRKTLITLIGQPGVGKTLFQTHFSTQFLIQGLNVLYITLEMDEFKISERIDSNLLNIPLKDLKNYDQKQFVNDFNKVVSNGLGKLITKEFATGTVNSLHIRSLLKELEMKEDFKPDVLLLDYLGIMLSQGNNLYESIKINAESLRAIAIDYDCCVITASQTNRDGFDKTTGISMSDIAESTAPLQISDGVFGISKKFDLNNTQQDMKVKEQSILMNIIKNRMGGNVGATINLKQNFVFMRLQELQGNDGGYLDKNDITIMKELQSIANLPNTGTSEVSEVSGVSSTPTDKTDITDNDNLFDYNDTNSKEDIDDLFK